MRRSVEELAAGGFCDARPTAPATWLVRTSAWAPLLSLDEDSPPLWRYWRELYHAVFALDAWAVRADAAGWTAYVAASRVRDAFEGLTPQLLRVALPLPAWEGEPEQRMEGLKKWVSDAAEMVRSSV